MLPERNAIRLKLVVKSACIYTPMVPSRGQYSGNNCLSFTLKPRWVPFKKAGSAATSISLMASDNSLKPAGFNSLRDCFKT